MRIFYEGAFFNTSWGSSIERNLIKGAIKRKIGRWIGKPYQPDRYLAYASALLDKKPSSVLVDVGANIGTTTLPLACRYQRAQFFAVEPHPLPASRFIQNCETNQIQNVTLITSAIGIGDSPHSFAQIYTCPTNSGGHRVTGFKGREDLKSHFCFGPILVPLQPLKKIFEEHKILSCDLLKIDTEGYEWFVLQSLGQKLDPSIVHSILVEYGPEGLRAAGTSGKDLVSLLLKKGYQCKIFGTENWIPSPDDLPPVPDFSVIDLLFTADSL